MKHTAVRSPRALRLHLFAAAALLAGLAPAAVAGTPPNVLILAAAHTTFPSNYYTDPQAKLIATGQFGSVDLIDARTTTPTLAQLQAYDAVLTWSNQNYADSVLLGDRLADYVNAGGGVVVAMFANTSTSVSRYLGGRWITGGYDVLVGQGGSTLGAATLGTVQVPGHPVMAGVSTFSGGTSSYRPTSTALTAGATLIASWSDGRILVAEHATRTNRIDLGMYPPSNAVSSGFWDQTTDGALLMANALTYVAGPQFTGTPFCFGDGSATACPCGNAGAAGNGCASSVNANGANLAATGSASIAHDSLVLQGSGMPNSSVLYFQGTSQQSGGAGVAFGDGLRCAGGTIIRLLTKANVAGASVYPAVGEIPVSVRGNNVAGNVRTYQCWYRNAAAFCTPSTFNLSNGVEITWTP